VATLNRILVLGFAATVLSPIVQLGIQQNIIAPLVGPEGLGLSGGLSSQLLLAMLQELGLLIVLPALAFCVGFLFDGRGPLLGVGAALFVKLFMLVVDYLGGGGAALISAPLYHLERLLLAVGIGILAGQCFEYSRRKLEAYSEGQRRMAPSEAPTAPKEIRSSLGTQAADEAGALGQAEEDSPTEGPETKA